MVFDVDLAGDAARTRQPSAPPTIVKMQPAGPADGRTQMLSTVPTGPFKVVELNFSKNNNAGQSLSEEEVARLAVFTDLESLEFSTLTDAGLAKLAPLKKLKSLIVPNNTLTPAAVATIRQFPQLEQLQASGDDEWLKPLAGMPTLRSMIFWKANVSPQAMSWFPQYPNLSQLRLNDCFEAPEVRLSVALAPLKDCKNLKKLFLNTSKFDADALAVLSGLTGLTELDLYQSNVSEAQLKQLAAARASNDRTYGDVEQTLHVPSGVRAMA